MHPPLPPPEKSHPLYFIRGDQKKIMWNFQGSCHKNRQKHSQHFELLFFTINLCFFTSKQIPTYRKPNFPLTSSICLVFLPLLWIHVFLLCLTRNAAQFFKRGSIKNHFLLSACFWYNLLFSECFLLYVITGRYYFS